MAMSDLIIPQPLETLIEKYGDKVGISPETNARGQTRYRHRAESDSPGVLVTREKAIYLFREYRRNEIHNNYINLLQSVRYVNGHFIPKKISTRLSVFW